MDRREFLKGLAVLSGSAVFSSAGIKCGGGGSGPKKLIYIALDSLDPRYLSLNAAGDAGGAAGNWLTPNLRAFVDSSVWYQNALSFMPAATDMNHLNAVAGTSLAQTGCFGISVQITGWDQNGKIIAKNSDLANFRDDLGRPVDTIFHAWKRKHPDSVTAMISGKQWVAEMFRSQGVVDLLVTGSNHPDYLSEVVHHNFNDPVTDTDPGCDPKGAAQEGLAVSYMQANPSPFPSDAWIVDAALQVFRRENPDLAYILLAEADDGGHGMGSAWDPDEFVPAAAPYSPPAGCENKPGYQLVSKRNPGVGRESLLDLVREVDYEFGRLIDGLKSQGVLDQAMVIVLSDHGMINHLDQQIADTDLYKMLADHGLADRSYVYPFCISSAGLLYYRENKQFVPQAKELLLAYRVTNPVTGESECPWWVLDAEDVKNGVAGLCLPGEMYHEYFFNHPDSGIMLPPDLVIFAKNGWQLPIYGGTVNAIGIPVPEGMPPMMFMVGGHGGPDTLRIIAAIHTPDSQPKTMNQEIRIADLAVTAAVQFGLTLQSTTVGSDLGSDL